MEKLIIEELFEMFIKDKPNKDDKEQIERLRNFYYGAIGTLVSFIRKESRKDVIIAPLKFIQIEHELWEHFEKEISKYENKSK
jgi:hypothetical protein